MLFDCPGKHNGRFYGMTRDHRRHMWLCDYCRKPRAGNWHYNPDCLWCGEPFTLDVFDLKAYHNATCKNCGGTNYAKE